MTDQGHPTRRRMAHWRDRLAAEIAAGTAPVRADARDRRFLVTAVLVSAAIFILAIRLRLLHGAPAGDEPAYLVISQTMQKYHSVDVMLDYRNRDYLAFYPAEMAPHVVPGPDGRPLSLHSVGGPLLWLLPFMAWGRAGALGFIAVVTVLVVANIYLFLRERQITAGYALFTTLLFAAGSPLYVYASMSFVEPICALIVLYAVRVLLADKPHPARLVTCCIGLAYAPWIHVRMLLPVAAIAGLLIGRFWVQRVGWPAYVCCLVPLVIGGVLLEWNSYAVWHSLSPAASQVAMGNGPFQIPLHTGLSGVLFDRQGGLIPNFPVFFLVLPGLLVTLRRPFWLLHLTLVLTIVPYEILVCTAWGFFGGYSPPARYAAVIIAPLAFYVATLIQRLGWWLAVLAGCAGIAGYAVALAADVHPDDRFQHPGEHNLPMDRLGESIRWSLADHLPSSFQPGQTGRFWASAAVTILVALMLWAAALGRRRQDRLDLPPRPGPRTPATESLSSVASGRA